MPTRRDIFLGLLASCAAPTACAQASAPVLVFAASSLQSALDGVATQWRQTTGRRVIFSYAASSALARQIEQGAPADLFAAADLDWMDHVASRGLLAADSRVNLLGNRLVLIAGHADTSPLRIAPGFDLAGALGEGRLATGNPASVPLGKYARAALTRLEVWDRIAPLVAGTESARAAVALVARGEAKFGIVFATDAKAEPKVRIIDTFPENSHPAVVYPFARLKASTNADAAAFLNHLRSPDARQLFEREGFKVLT